MEDHEILDELANIQGQVVSRRRQLLAIYAIVIAGNIAATLGSFRRSEWPWPWLIVICASALALRLAADTRAEIQTRLMRVDVLSRFCVRK